MIILILLGTLIVGFFRFLYNYLHNTFRHPGTIAFFHPYCEGGGGGERVLFQAIDTLINAAEGSGLRFSRIIIYSKATTSTVNDILNNVRERFQIGLTQGTGFAEKVSIELVQLKTVPLLNPKIYPRFTLLCQSLAEGLAAFEAIYRFLPEVFVDTTGCPFTLPVFRWIGGCRVACYVHYPTITAQMTMRVSDKKKMYNNADFIANSSVLTNLKIVYYSIFSLCYRFCGYAAHVVMTNGSWTTEHIKFLWKVDPIKVYPPVDVHLYERGHKVRSKTPATILSVGQIRPEKNHRLQLEVLNLLKQSDVNVKLIVAGGSRNEEDNQRLKSLQQYAMELGVDKYVEWKINISNDELRELNNTSLIGIHTMIDEHFGIAVVESMAAGCIMIAHNSGGPKLDIVKDGENGFLADNAEGYASCVRKIMNSTDMELSETRNKAVEHVEIFSVNNFSNNFSNALKMLK